MASDLCCKGFRLTVNDINFHVVAELERLQTSSALTVAELAEKSDIIVTMLPNSAINDDAVSRADGILAHARPGSLILDMSTIDPGITESRKGRRRKKIVFVGAPVGRLASHADRGESLFIVVRLGQGFRTRQTVAGSNGDHDLTIAATWAATQRPKPSIISWL